MRNFWILKNATGLYLMPSGKFSNARRDARDFDCLSEVEAMLDYYEFAYPRLQLKMERMFKD